MKMPNLTREMTTTIEAAAAVVRVNFIQIEHKEEDSQN
jgi:hypothetical protein